MSKILNNNGLDVSIDKDRNVLKLSLKKYSERTKSYYNDRNISLKEGIHLNFDGIVYTDIELVEVLDEEKIYSFKSTFSYINYIKDEINVNSLFFLYEEKEPWFEINVSNYIGLIFDPLFSKINKSNNFENMLYIPKDKNILKRFLVREGIWLNDNLNNEKNNHAVLLKNIEYEYIGMTGLNSTVNIKYGDFFILSKSDVRKLKINNLIL